ncbi:MAG: TIM-barrel domain-containing protein [Acidobacteriaceae bacterium]
MFTLILLSPVASIPAFAQPGTVGEHACAHIRAGGSSSLRNGIEIQSGEIREEIIALQENVLRITIARNGAFPKDASWAVLTKARNHTVAVTPDNGSERVGFRTKLLQVQIDRKTLELTVRDADGTIVQQDARPMDFHEKSFRIYKTMPVDEHYFGLGDKPGPLDHRNEAFTLWNTDAYRFQESTDPLYKSIPFFMTFRAGRAAGVLLDNTWRSSFDFGKESPTVYSFGAVNGPVDYYIIYGPSPRRVVESYAWLTGTPPLPPMWALGYQQSRYSYYPQSRVLEIADRLRHDRIPADAIYLDIDFQEKNRPFTVDRQRFPDFSGMIAKLNAENFHVVAITDPHIANLPAQHYFPYDSGIAGSHFVRNPDGSIFTGMVWPGPSVFPDFTRQQTRQWWGSLYREFYREGIAGFWNDMNEPSVFNTVSKTIPLDVIDHIDEPGFQTRSTTQAEVHNIYGLENSRATFDGLKQIKPDLRPFVLTRATYAGGQRYAVTWTGDNSSTWNHLRLSTFMIENLGLSGFAFSGADVGGYAGTPPPDLLTKWFEIATFQPIDRDHTEKGTENQEPWVDGPAQEAIRRRFIEERYRLMLYLYTLAEEASRTGMPMVRPLFLEFPNAASDHRPIDVDVDASGEFLLGPDLLIAPSPYPEELDGHAVEFPSTNWYDYWTGKRVPGPVSLAAANVIRPLVPHDEVPLSIQVHHDLATLPVFVRAGSILPTAPLVESTNETPQGPLTLRVYAPNPAGNDPCGGKLYIDDGRTYAYRHGAYLRMKFTCHLTKHKLTLNIAAHRGSYPAWWKEIRLEIYGWEPREHTVFLNGNPLHSPLVESSNSVAFTIPDDANGADLQLK